MGDNADDTEAHDTESYDTEYDGPETDAAEIEEAYEAGGDETVPGLRPPPPTRTSSWTSRCSRSTRSTWTSRTYAPMCRSRPRCSTC